MEDTLFEDIQEFLKTPEPLDEFDGKLITEAELDAVLMAFIEHRGEVTEEEAVAVVRWAENAVLNHTLLQLILRGEIKIDIREDGEFVFGKLDK